MAATVRIVLPPRRTLPRRRGQGADELLDLLEAHLDGPVPSPAQMLEQRVVLGHALHHGARTIARRRRARETASMPTFDDVAAIALALPDVIEEEAAGHYRGR